MTNWVKDVAETGIFYKPSDLPEEYGYNKIPSGWTVINKDNLPLTFKGTSSTNAVQLYQVGSPDSITLDYKKNNGAWTTYNVGDIIELDQDETVAFSGANDHFSKDNKNRYKFVMTGEVTPYGNIQSLMNWSDNVVENCYVCLFINCDFKDASNIKLPVTSLADGSYMQMFRNCHSLTAAPELPATTLARECYNNMFYQCWALSTAPALPASTLADYCYDYMFFACHSLTAAPELPATTLAEGCYLQMFGSCRSLTSAPVLPATELVENCYKEMFSDCTSLSSMNVSFTDWNDDATENWVGNVASTGIFYKPAALSEEYGIGKIPEGWTVTNK